MTRRNWKHAAPASLREALRFCKDYAAEKKNFSVERLAELMGTSEDALYKWLSTGRMPANLISGYEHHCGIDFVSRYLALSSGKLVIDMPTGRALKPTDGHELQTVLNTAVGAVLAFASGAIDADKAIADIEAGMAALAWHRGNVVRHQQPELSFDQEAA